MHRSQPAPGAAMRSADPALRSKGCWPPPAAIKRVWEYGEPRPHLTRWRVEKVSRLGIEAWVIVSREWVLRKEGAGTVEQEPWSRNRGVWLFWWPASLQTRHGPGLVHAPRIGSAGENRLGGGQCQEWRTPLIHRLKGNVPRSYRYCRTAQASPSGPATAIFPTISRVFKSTTATYPSRPQAA